MPQHYMQTELWAGVKQRFGWKYSLHNDVIAYNRSVPGVGKLCYVPGVMGVTDPEELTESVKAQAGKSFAVRLELNQPYDEDLLKAFEYAGWKASHKHVQYRHTVTVDLSLKEDDIWMSFKSRGRYEVLQAQKFGVVVEEAETTDANLQKMYELMKVTSVRNKFYIRDSKFTMAYWKAFSKKGQLKLFFARHEDDILAGAVILTNGELAWYKDGGSVRLKSNMMAARLLQWEAMKSLKKAGITSYDLGGIPAPESHQDSSMRGIYVFKSAYSKESVELMPTLELPLSLRYKLWPKAEKQWLRAYNFIARNLWW